VRGWYKKGPFVVTWEWVMWCRRNSRGS
jgi:hypothetical protein